MEGRKVIVCDIDKCTGCELCEYACSVYRDGRINPSGARISHLRIEPVFDIAIACMKCADPPCVRACQRDAMLQLPDGSIRIDMDKCNFCGWCIDPCKFGAIQLDHARHLVTACDFCAGLDGPMCVEVCPYEALSYESLEDAPSTPGKLTFARLMEELG